MARISKPIRNNHIKCDCCGEDSGNNWVYNHWYMKEIESALREQGWVLGKRDLCPECVKAEKEQKELDKIPF